MMKGMNIEGMRKHPSLIPLFAFLGIGCSAAFFYTLRLATRCPDVAWNRHVKPEPWQDYANKDYKFYRPAGESAADGVQGPKF